MKAGIYLGKEHIEIRELPLPETGDNDVLIQNLYSSICGTDVSYFLLFLIRQTLPLCLVFKYSDYFCPLLKQFFSPNIFTYQNKTEVIKLKQIKIACTGYILISIVFYITGFLCIINPELIRLHGRTLAGAILTAYGIIKIIGYFSKDLYCLAFQYDFACGIFLIVLGIAALCISSRFKDSSLLAALGILVLLDSLLSIQTALDSKKFGLSSWKYILIFSMVTGTFGVLVILKSTITFAGCALLAEGGMRHYIVQHTARLPDYHYLNDNELSK